MPQCDGGRLVSRVHILVNPFRLLRYQHPCSLAGRYATASVLRFLMSFDILDRILRRRTRIDPPARAERQSLCAGFPFNPCAR